VTRADAPRQAGQAIGVRRRRALAETIALLVEQAEVTD
jgi:hypothetical protein